MSQIDFVVLGILLICVILAIAYLKKHGSSCGECSGCKYRENCKKKTGNGD